MSSASRLSIDRIKQAAEIIDPIFLNTPQFINEPLSDVLGVRLVIKIETLNPVRSFKGRGSDFLISQVETGSHLITASAGNFGQAMAYACRKYGVELTVYASKNANPLKLSCIRAFGATVVLFGKDFDEAKQEGKRKAMQNGLRFIEDSLDIETLEGAGTLGLELLKTTENLDCLLIPLGNGALFNSVAKVIKEFHPKIKTIAVQATGASAMIDSWRTGKIIKYEEVDTIADGIAVRVPIPQALNDMQGLIDDAIAVQDHSIIKGMQLLHQHAGIVSEPSGAVGIAAILENPTKFSGQTVGSIICGGNLTQEQTQKWLFQDYNSENVV